MTSFVNGISDGSLFALVAISSGVALVLYFGWRR